MNINHAHLKMYIVIELVKNKLKNIRESSYFLSSILLRNMQKFFFFLKGRGFFILDKTNSVTRSLKNQKGATLSYQATWIIVYAFIMTVKCVFFTYHRVW